MIHPELSPTLPGARAFGATVAAVLGLSLASPGQEQVRTRATIDAPPGYEVVEVAAPPLVSFPVMAVVDERGRLFVAENAGVNLNDKDLLEQKPSRILLLEDDNGDGIYDRSSVFVDELTFPQGVLWYRGSLYVASPPSIWRFTDTDDDGRADRREELVTGFRFTGNAADVHGPFLHPNGRLYWTHGRKGHEVRSPDGSVISTGLGARVWSAKPDGSDVQVFAGGGLDNPVELVFTQEGEIFGTANLFLSSPRNDAIVHWVRGGVYPRTDQDNVLNEFTRTGDLLSPAAFLGHVAPAGLALMQAGSGREGEHVVLHAEFNTRRIMRTRLRPNGAGYIGLPEVFASSETDGLHFTDVLVDADGSLLLINTGSWFRIGCPTSGVARPDPRGAIYRLRNMNTAGPQDPLGLALRWETLEVAELTDLLGDGRPFVRSRAIEEVVRRGDAQYDLWTRATGDSRHLVRSNAIWALTRIGTPAAQAAVRPLLRADDPRLRQTAAHSAGITRDAEAVPLLLSLLADASDAVRREAASSLGLIGRGECVGPLLEAASRTEDLFLTHAIVLALVECGNDAVLAKAFDDGRVRVRRAALLALRERGAANLDPRRVLGLLKDAEGDLTEIVLSIVSRQVEKAAWTDAAVETIEWAFAGESDPKRRDVGARLLPLFLGTEPAMAWLSRNLGQLSGQRPDILESVLEAIARSPKAWNDDWRSLLTTSLGHASPRVAEAATRAVVAHRQRGFDDLLARLVVDSSHPVSLRLAALQRPRNERALLEQEAFVFVTELVRTGGANDVRSRAATILSEARLTRDQALLVATLLPSAGPLELPALILALTRSPADEEIGQAVLAALREAPARWGLDGGQVQSLFRRYPAEVSDAAQTLIGEIMNQALAKDTRLSELEASITGGDASRGRLLFESGGGTCVACHRIGEVGGTIGPDLSTIGRIRTERDLLEAIAFPGATIARGYETFEVVLKSGERLTGTIPREDDTSIVVIAGGNAEARLLRKEVESVVPSPVSLMPPGLDRLLSSQELADLVTYLRSLK